MNEAELRPVYSVRRTLYSTARHCMNTNFILAASLTPHILVGIMKGREFHTRVYMSNTPRANSNVEMLLQCNARNLVRGRRFIQRVFRDTSERPRVSTSVVELHLIFAAFLEVQETDRVQAFAARSATSGYRKSACSSRCCIHSLRNLEPLRDDGSC
jgi:hypothetical protein